MVQILPLNIVSWKGWVNFIVYWCNKPLTSFLCTAFNVKRFGGVLTRSDEFHITFIAKVWRSIFEWKLPLGVKTLLITLTFANGLMEYRCWQESIIAYFSILANLRSKKIWSDAVPVNVMYRIALKLYFNGGTFEDCWYCSWPVGSRDLTECFFS